MLSGLTLVVISMSVYLSATITYQSAPDHSVSDTTCNPYLKGLAISQIINLIVFCLGIAILIVVHCVYTAGHVCGTCLIYTLLIVTMLCFISGQIVLIVYRESSHLTCDNHRMELGMKWTIGIGYVGCVVIVLGMIRLISSEHQNMYIPSIN